MKTGCRMLDRVGASSYSLRGTELTKTKCTQPAIATTATAPIASGVPDAIGRAFAGVKGT